jgi:hypothetical protein
MNRILIICIVIALLTLACGAPVTTNLIFPTAEPTQPAPLAITASAANQAHVIADILNLRTCPATSCAADDNGLKYGALVIVTRLSVATTSSDPRDCPLWDFIITTDGTGRSGFVCAEYVVR